METRGIIVIGEFQNKVILPLYAYGNVDIGDKFKEVQEWVRENCQVPCSASTISEEILNKFGLYIDKTQNIVSVPDRTLVKTPLERLGCSVACCGDCSAFDEGNVCFKYGGPCDPFDTDGNGSCLHGVSGYELCYSGESVTKKVLMIDSPNSTDLYDLAKKLAKDAPGVLTNVAFLINEIDPSKFSLKQVDL